MVSSPANQQFHQFSGWSPKNQNKKKGIQSGKPPNSTSLEMISKKKENINNNKKFFLHHNLGIDKRSDLERCFC